MTIFGQCNLHVVNLMHSLLWNFASRPQIIVWKVFRVSHLKKCPLCISKHLFRALGSYMITICIKATYRKAKNDKDFLVVFRAFGIRVFSPAQYLQVLSQYLKNVFTCKCNTREYCHNTCKFWSLWWYHYLKIDF